MDAHKMIKLLTRAQDIYGYANQVTVATEELCELAQVLCKYPRYPDHQTASGAIRPKVVEEIADVIICLQHLYLIFNIESDELDRVMDAKLERLQRWLDASDDFYQSTIDREVKQLGDN
jgi:NTP pyrophosphatase (non-canonical NTP hydrolase)